MSGAGDRDRRVTIERAPLPWPPDAAGQPTPEWGLYAKAWAKQRPQTSAERQLTQGISAIAEFVLEIPGDSKTRQISSSEEWRLQNGNRFYDITFVDDTDYRKTGLIYLHVRGRGEVAA